MERFEKVVPRKGTRSVKWDMAKDLYQDKDVLPMWVADMDFETPRAVTEALKERVEHGIFGYTIPDDLVKKEITQWLENRHRWEIHADWISYSPGVIPSLHMIIQSLTEIGDHILIQTPVYPPFYSVIKDHGRHVVKNPLYLNEERYNIDFDDFEKKIKENQVTMFILCNPHNPVGRVWSKEELERMMDICLKHDVKVVADEIHADLIYKGNVHIPIASLSKEAANQTITCLSPTKTFNLAGLQASYLVIPNDSDKKKVDHHFKNQGMMMLNTLGVTAMEAAYRHGEEWLDHLNTVLESHRDYVIHRFHSETSSIRVLPAEGTYLLWMDCRELGMTQSELKSFMQKEAKVGLNDGASFGVEGEGFMRLNIAAPKSIIEEGVSRMVKAVQDKEK
ncbi:MalY/PatB family protein [Halobacillus karajensis]|uniref:cysteine-S-conjugate beta-lyase n=1 Tax=Halobacillus karajensis TaxID=195088 RepID=A0A024P922_9BACI|nr:MalY/PatB family protein [Halobacillus karajensis]CDQ21311.1 Cystathionine beta-lyase PatB [Halobacillus karajensis]CDQ25619.1 Cystathionine beta-lyase PatB [Halobacillus karajensis]CDQ25890.1 Cystathionine beta-lyase PatB [Halobacillus karajensis]